MSSNIPLSPFDHISLKYINGNQLVKCALTLYAVQICEQLVCTLTCLSSSHNRRSSRGSRVHADGKEKNPEEAHST